MNTIINNPINQLETSLDGIINLVKSTKENTYFTIAKAGKDTQNYSIIGYLISLDAMNTIEEICMACPDRIPDLFACEDVVERLMETNGKFSDYMLMILKDMVSKKIFQTYLFHSNYSDSTINRFLVYCEFSSAFERIVAQDNGELLHKFLSSPEQYNDFCRIVRKREGKNLWQQCIDCYAVECEAVLKEMISVSRAI